MGHQHFGALCSSLEAIVCGANPQSAAAIAQSIYSVGALLEMLGEANRTLSHKHAKPFGSSLRGSPWEEKCNDKNGNAPEGKAPSPLLRQQAVENRAADVNRNAEIVEGGRAECAAEVEELSDWSIGVEQWVATVLANKDLSEFFESCPDLSKAIAAYRENKRAPRQEV